MNAQNGNGNPVPTKQNKENVIPVEKNQNGSANLVWKIQNGNSNPVWKAKLPRPLRNLRTRLFLKLPLMEKPKRYIFYVIFLYAIF